MTTAQKTFIEVQKRQSTLRGEFNAIRATDAPTDEQRARLATLDGELTESETEFWTRERRVSIFTPTTRRRGD